MIGLHNADAEPAPPLARFSSPQHVSASQSPIPFKLRPAPFALTLQLSQPAGTPQLQLLDFLLFAAAKCRIKSIAHFLKIMTQKCINEAELLTVGDNCCVLSGMDH